MNTHAKYRRRGYRAPAPSRDAAADMVPDPILDPILDPSGDPTGELHGARLAHRADPPIPAPQQAPTSSRRVAWVRPTELPSYAAPMVGRGIDLQGELICRTRRTHITAPRAAARGVHQLARTERPAPREEVIER